MCKLTKLNIAVGIKSPQRMSYDEAFLYCMTSTENGYKDWRLPISNESGNLSSILVWCDDDIYKDTENEFFAIPVRTIDA